MAAKGDDKLLMPPSEFSGDGWLTGRVVLLRMVNLPERDLPHGGKAGSKNKGVKGKGAQSQEGDKTKDKTKCELHLLGGTTMGEVVFIEAWGDGATALHTSAEQAQREEKLLALANVKIINQYNKYSTSRLSWYVRVIAPVGIRSKVELVTADGRWAQLPKHHPWLDIANIRKVQSDVQHCIKGVVQHQPGKKNQDTKFGQAEVCNAILTADGKSIRCGFWRQHADKLAAFAEGDAIALYQVNVVPVDVKGTSSWEIRATEATLVTPCPAEFAESLHASVAANTGPLDALTAPITKDFDTAAASLASLGALAAVMVPSELRSLDGVYEVHNVAILGVNTVLKTDEYCMMCCETCKVQFEAGSTRCNQHPDAAATFRWLLQLELADDTGHCSAMLFHDVAMKIPDFLAPELPLPPKPWQKHIQRLRALPWSVRLVYNTNETRGTNRMEVKMMLPTLTPEGMVSTWRLDPVPTVKSNTACPLAKCASVRYDPDLGFADIDGEPVSAFRLLVKLLDPTEDEDTAIPDTDKGLRVTRRVVCALAPEATPPAEYCLTAAGLSSTVQWLVLAAGVYLATATKRADDSTFVVQAYHKIDDVPTWTKYVAATIAAPRGPKIDFTQHMTPLKRKREIDSAAPAPTSAPMSTRVSPASLLAINVYA